LGHGQGLTDALLDLELYSLLVPLAVHDGKEMFSLAHGATDLVILGGLSDMAFVQMLSNRIVTTCVGGLEYKFLAFPSEVFWTVEDAALLWMNHIDLRGSGLSLSPAFIRRQRDKHPCNQCS